MEGEFFMSYSIKEIKEGINYHNEVGKAGDFNYLNNEVEILQLLRKKGNPYERCPIYVSKSFIFRMVEEKDAEDLLECYSNSESAKLFNSDNCTSDFIYKSLEEMKNCIKFWIDQYNEKYYVRFSIIDKLNNKAIGTIEFFAKPVDYNGIFKVGVLRLDLVSQYENEETIAEILEIVNNNFYDDFEVKHVITKAIPIATQRIAALEKESYIKLEDKTIVPYDSYFIRYEHYEV
jgi:RimJ/RimL family protein N-acetyltransferase